jgi:hemerythrin
MGMTDRQFDAYHSRLLRILKDISEENDLKVMSDKLKDLTNEIETELKRP